MLEKLTDRGRQSDAVLEVPVSTRIITYAWGDKYIDVLLSLNIPSLLAPGNIPHLAAKMRCEVVVLTEERFFRKVALHPAILRMQDYCDVRLISIDDLISVPDKYGMALTYTLHRGFADLGPAMTDSWQIFLNADFILADGSLSRLLPHLTGVERIIASPSYCVNAEAVIPELRKRIDPHSLALSLAPREMADLVLRYRHNTIRGKTFTQHSIAMRYMDQFYWQVDSNTLLGYQMPVAIVALRPERYLRDPNAYWDHGLMREYCPNASPRVLGDSDDFLMLELRDEDTARDQISVGWPSASEIASHMMVFLTPYQKEYLQYPLTLHSADLPADVEASRKKLKARVEGVFTHVPGILPSHRNHPQWQYHQHAFEKSRHAKLSERYGRRTATMPPPSTLSELDQAWWKLDGLQKSYQAQRVECVKAMEQDIKWLDDAIVEDGLPAPRVGNEASPAERPKENDRRNADRALLRELSALVDRASSVGEPELFFTTTILHRASSDHGERADESESWLDQSLGTLLDHRRRESGMADPQRLELARAMIKQYYERRLFRIEADYRANRQPLQAEYDRLMPRGMAVAEFPHVDVRSGPIVAPPLTGNLPVRLAKVVYYSCFGQVPRVTRLNPLWGSLRHVTRIIDAAAANGASNVFIVSSQRSPIEKLADPFSGKLARMSVATVLSDNFDRAVEHQRDFDLCICVLEYEELDLFPKIVKAISPSMRPGGSIIGFYWNSTLGALSPNDSRLITLLSNLAEPTRIYYSGSARTAGLMRGFQALRSGGGNRMWRGARFAFNMLQIGPRAFAASWAEESSRSESPVAPPSCYTSITLELRLGNAPPQQ